MLEKYKKRVKPKALPEMPRAGAINVIQFQFFDNGQKPGRGKSRHVVKLEVYCEGRLNLRKPFWKRSVSMLEPKLFFEWIDGQTFEPGVKSIYENLHSLAIDQEADDEVEWVKLGHVEDTRLRARYPGQFVVCVKCKDGPLLSWVQAGDGQFPCEAMIFNQRWKRGSKERLFYGFYDPHGMYKRMIAEQQMIAEAASRGAARDDLAIDGEFAEFMRGGL